MKAVNFINEGNKESLNKASNVDQVYYSELKEWFTTNAFRSLSIKFVLQGSIYYKVEGEEYKVKDEHFLLATRQPDVKAYFKSITPVKSLCIDICEDTLNDGFTVLANEQKNEITDYNADLMQHPYFMESIYPACQNKIGEKLQSLSARIGDLSLDDPVCVNREWFLEMVELIILNEFKNYNSLKNIHALKTSTQKEILKRVSAGREFIDQFFLENPDIKTIAKESYMSEFHFFRSFKQVFGDSPYQYILSKRLEHASVLLMEKQLMISEVASECGFPDVFTFSKAFKRKYGTSPSKLNFPHQ